MSLLQTDGVGLWGPDLRRGNKLGPLIARGLSDAYLEETIRIGDSPETLDFWWSRQTFAVEDVATDPRVPEVQRAALLREGFRSILNTQVRVGDELFGSFTVGRRSPHRFSQQEQRLLSALGQRAGLAIRNARLFEQSQQAAALQ